eukprot:2790563-Prymnesium_polylepis.1
MAKRLFDGLQDKEDVRDEQAKKKLEDGAGGHESEESREEDCARCLDGWPVESPWVERRVEEGEGRREWRARLGFDGSATSEEQTGVEERHANAEQGDRKQSKCQEGQRCTVAMALHCVVGGKEALLRPVNLLEAVALAERLEALRGNGRVEQVLEHARRSTNGSTGKTV